MAPEYRSTHDYNRDSSINTEFRKKIRNYIRSVRGKTLVYEVHSFPDGNTEFGRRQMVIFDISKNYNKGRCLLRHLEPLGLDIVQTMGNPIVSLQQEFKDMENVSHHLLEFNEGERLTDDEEDQITSALADFRTGKIWPFCYAQLALIVLIVLILLVKFAFEQHVSTGALKHAVADLP